MEIFQYNCNQKHVNILGRTIDIESLLTEQLNLFIRENIEIIINRYENATITSSMEIKLTVEMLGNQLPGIDKFDDILQEINEDTTVNNIYNGLFSNLLRNYIYNQLTERFVLVERPKGNLWGSRLEVFLVLNIFNLLLN